MLCVEVGSPATSKRLGRVREDDLGPDELEEQPPYEPQMSQLRVLCKCMAIATEQKVFYLKAFQDEESVNNQEVCY